ELCFQDQSERERQRKPGRSGGPLRSLRGIASLAYQFFPGRLAEKHLRAASSPSGQSGYQGRSPDRRPDERKTHQIGKECSLTDFGMTLIWPFSSSTAKRTLSRPTTPLLRRAAS